MRRILTCFFFAFLFLVAANGIGATRAELLQAMREGDTSRSREIIQDYAKVWKGGQWNHDTEFIALLPEYVGKLAESGDVDGAKKFQEWAIDLFIEKDTYDARQKKNTKIVRHFDPEWEGYGKRSGRFIHKSFRAVMAEMDEAIEAGESESKRRAEALVEKERQAREEAERMALEKAEAERQVREETERMAREKAEAERQAREEAERMAREKAEAEEEEQEEEEDEEKEEDFKLFFIDESGDIRGPANLETLYMLVDCGVVTPATKMRREDSDEWVAAETFFDFPTEEEEEGEEEEEEKTEEKKEEENEEEEKEEEPLGAIFILIGGICLVWAVLKGLKKAFGQILSGDALNSRSNDSGEEHWRCRYCGKTTTTRRGKTPSTMWTSMCSRHPAGFCKGPHDWI